MWKKLKSLLTDAKSAKRRKFLRSLSLCEGLSERDVGHLLHSFHSRTYHEGESLFVEGDIGRALFVVESGRVELSKHGADGQPRRIATLGPGTFFGEMALLEQLPRSASAVALERSTLLLLYRSKVDEILVYHPRVGVAIMAHLAKLLSSRLRKASQELASAETGAVRQPAPPVELPEPAVETEEEVAP